MVGGLGFRTAKPTWSKGLPTDPNSQVKQLTDQVCVYYCSTLSHTYYKAVREGGEGGVEDVCYERLRAEAYVN